MGLLDEVSASVVHTHASWECVDSAYRRAIADGSSWDVVRGLAAVLDQATREYGQAVHEYRAFFA